MKIKVKKAKVQPRNQIKEVDKNFEILSNNLNDACKCTGN